MPQTSKMQWIYPSEDQNPWFDIFARMIAQIDQSAYARLEDSSFIIMGGGTIDWDLSTSTLTWSSAIEIIEVQTAGIFSIAAGSLTLTEGAIFYVNVSRGTTGTIAVTARKANTLPTNDDSICIAIRRDDKIYFRNGRVFVDGYAGAIYTASGFKRNQISIGTNGDTFIGTGGTPTATTQGGLSAGFSDAIMAPDSVDVFYGTALCHYTAGVPASTSEWTWVTGGSPAPVIQIGAGSTAGDIVTVKYPI